MNQKNNTVRDAQAEVSDVFIGRWSPRSFNKEFEIEQDQVESIFEAARWAPSSYNEQPWTFLVAKRGTKNFDSFFRLLDEANQEWAGDASLIGFVVASKHFKKNQMENSCAEFDCGSAWMSMSLQARKLGLYTHGMAGFDKKSSYKVLGVDEKSFKIICGFAVGAVSDPSELPGHLEEVEKPNDRKELSDVFHEGTFNQTKH